MTRPSNTITSAFRPPARSRRPLTGTPARCRSSSTGSGQTVSVPAGEIVEADISDTYGLLPGQLEVTKTIAGPLAGQAGDGRDPHGLQRHRPHPRLRHPGRDARGDQSQHLLEYPRAGQLCGHRDRGRVTPAPSRSSSLGARKPPVSSRPAGLGPPTSLTPTAPPPAPSLVTKTIAGPRAGHQGPVTIHVVCDGIALVAGLRDRRRDPGGQRVAQLRRHPGWLGVHRHRDRGRRHRHGHGDRVGQSARR